MFEIDEFLMFRIFFDLIILLSWFFVLFSNNLEDEINLVFKKKFERKDFLYILKILFIFLIVLVLSSLFYDVFDKEYEDLKKQIDIRNISLFQFYLIYFSVVLLGPISEEIFFRRFLFKIFRNRFGFSFSSTFTSLIFSITHLNFLISFIYSMILCSVYEERKNLTINFVIHIAWNFVMLMIFLISEVL